MARVRRSPKRVPRGIRVAKAAPEGADGVAVVLEDVRSQMKVVIEAVLANGEKTDRLGVELRQEMGELRRDLESQIRGGVEKTDKLGVDLRAELRSELGGLRKDMVEGFERVHADIADLRKRVGGLERAVSH
jgi:hypothetical protein